VIAYLLPPPGVGLVTAAAPGEEVSGALDTGEGIAVVVTVDVTLVGEVVESMRMPGGKVPAASWVARFVPVGVLTANGMMPGVLVGLDTITPPCVFS
jgi:hypothetical protein